MFTFRELLEVERGRPGAAVAPGLSTGLDDLDELTMGLGAGQVWLVTGAPRVGRSSWAAYLAGSAALEAPGRVCLVSPRDDERLVLARLIAAQGRVPLHHLLSRRLDADDGARCRRASGALAASGLRVHFPRVSSTARSFQGFADRSAARLLIIDDLHMWASGQVIAAIEALSAWAVRTAGTVLVTVPDDLVPDGGAELAAWSQNIDIAIRLARPQQDASAARRIGEVDLDVFWHRLGPTAVLTADFQGFYSRIVSPPR